MSSDGEIFEIFSWFPAKTIYKIQLCMQMVHKINVRSFLSFFLAKQSHNMMLKNYSSFFIQSDFPQRYNNEKLMEHPLPGEDSSVSHNSLQFLRKTARILASSNGLLLCRSTMKKNQIELFICNPATQTWLSIPTPPESSRVLTGVDVNVVFECNSSIVNNEEFPHDYMLIIFQQLNEWSTASYFECKIFSPKEGIWKERGEFNFGGRRISFEMPVYYNGALHFISDCFPYLKKDNPYYRPYIIAYDIEKGRSNLLRLPKEARRGSDDRSCKMGIFKWGVSFNSICLIRLRKCVFTAWVVEDNCWIRILKIRVGAMGLKEPNPWIVGFTVMNGNSLVFATKEKVYRYGLMGERYRKIEDVCHHECGCNYVHFIPYSNTLRPCGIHAKPLII